MTYLLYFEKITISFVIIAIRITDLAMDKIFYEDKVRI